MFVSIRGGRPKAFTPLGPQDEDEFASTLSIRERAMKRSSKGWSKKTQVMEGFAFTIKTQAGKEDLPVTCQWKPLVASPSESPKTFTRPDQSEPTSYFLESNPVVPAAPAESSLTSIKFNWTSNQDLRSVFTDLKGWISRKKKPEAPQLHAKVLHTPETGTQESKPVQDIVSTSTVTTDPEGGTKIVILPQRIRPRHPPRPVDLSERSETSWMELWKAAKAGIARDNAILPTRQIASGISLRKQITIRGSPLRQSHVISIVMTDDELVQEVVNTGDPEAAAAVQEAISSIIHHFDLPHIHKKTPHRKRILANQVTRNEFRQNSVGQYSKCAGRPVSVRPRLFPGVQISSVPTKPIPV